MVLKFQGNGNTWILKESNGVSHSHFIVEPKEMEKVNLVIENNKPGAIIELPEGVSIEGFISKEDPFISFEDLIEKKLEDEFGICSDNFHHCFGETPDFKEEKLFFGIAVVLDNNEVYVLDGSRQAYIINSNGKTIDKL